jgi:hypothetical protein
LELGIWDAGYANSGWGGGPINWHNYKELDAQFDYIKVCAAFKVLLLRTMFLRTTQSLLC